MLEYENIQIGLYSFDSKRLTLRFNQQIQQLTEKEAALIEYFYIHQNQLLKREQILTAIWGNDDFFSGRSMDVYISKLRKYFKDDAGIRIESIRNIGLEFKIIH
nr:winged helix-turn-helix domain-containing protein [uncultured Flavobacterium sp.]